VYAVLGTWMEEDVVEATVRNALEQGVDKVYLVDNGSTDATVDRAVGAGAVLAESFRTEVYEERVRILFMNGVVARVSLASGAAHIWWLWIDGDEFPEGRDDMTIAEYLRTLDRRFRLVGSTCYNHFPTGSPAYIPGFHPLDFQSMAELFAPPYPRYCAQPHWKHPLQRFDRSGPFLNSLMGFHGATLLKGEPVIEPVGGIVTHHFPYREEWTTRRRLELLCGGEARNAYNDSLGNSSIKKRFDTLDAVYAQQWERVDDLSTRGPHLGVHLEPWSGSGRPRRWYAGEELAAAKDAWKSGSGGDAVPGVASGSPL